MKDITIVGSGTAGLINALILRKAFPHFNITIISSSKIGIIGVGEGSTEHWRTFMEQCDIPLLELIVETKATHKNGIRFEGWTNHTPDYFHSVTATHQSKPFNVFSLYAGLIKDGKLLTENTASRALIENKVQVNGMHRSVNQYHFDTFALNSYLTSLCIQRNIKMIDAEVEHVIKNPENGYIDSVVLSTKSFHKSDFWIDASGFKRVLIKEMPEVKWISYSDYLLIDSAIAFPTESDPSGEIRPYTRAKAMENGWMWEIPTQERRGNGYVYSSAHCSEDEAIQAASEKVGHQVIPGRSIKFESGCLEKMWINNCVAVGLASSFVEPLEATSIGSTIQQANCLVENLGTFKPGNTFHQKSFNMKMSSMMENILCMISLHYASDRQDSKFWKDVSMAKKPDYLEHLIGLWSERPMFPGDIKRTGYEMFLEPHFFHVAHGQGLINKDSARQMLLAFDLELEARNLVSNAKLNQVDHERIDHGQALREIQI